MRSYNPKLSSGYASLEALAWIRGLKLGEFLAKYEVQYNIRNGNLFWNVAGIA